MGEEGEEETRELKLTRLSQIAMSFVRLPGLSRSEARAQAQSSVFVQVDQAPSASSLLSSIQYPIFSLNFW